MSVVHLMVPKDRKRVSACGVYEWEDLFPDERTREVERATCPECRDQAPKEPNPREPKPFNDGPQVV